jgi:hypothetical protein
LAAFAWIFGFAFGAVTDLATGLAFTGAASVSASEEGLASTDIGKRIGRFALSFGCCGERRGLFGRSRAAR